MQCSCNGIIFNISINDGSIIIIGSTIGVVVKVGINVDINIYIDSRWWLIREGKLTLKTKCLLSMLIKQDFKVASIAN